MMKTDLTWRRYLKYVFISSLALVGLIGTFNIAVDPMSIFGSPTITGFNKIKPHLDHDREFSRWQLAKRECADVGVFGNSRAEMGINPENSAFLKVGNSVFNHAIPGSRAHLAYSQLSWLKSIGCLPKTVFLGVEFFDFLGAIKARSLSLPETINPPQLDGKFLGESVFSINGLMDALSTVALPMSQNPATLTNLGFNPALNYRHEVQKNGHYVLFRQRAEESARNWSKKPPTLVREDGSLSDDQSALNAIFDTFGKEAKVYVIIYPYHAQLRMMVERLGLGGLFSEWKRYIVDLATLRNGSGANIEVWDFSGISTYTSEEVPVRGDKKTDLTYFWEAGHFKEELGRKMISTILSEPLVFGDRLDENNVGVKLLEDRQKVQALLNTPSIWQAEVNDVASRVLKTR
jgi:hypothetical protein